MVEIHPIDLMVGRKVRQGRQEAGMSQEELGTPLGITFQQIQKYEKGLNRVSASRLWEIGELIGKSVNWFFEVEAEEIVADKNSLRVYRAYKAIENTKQAKSILSLMEAMGACNESN